MIYLISIVAVLVTVLIVNGCLQPKTFSVSRSIPIDKNAEYIYQFIEDLREWDKWSPWAEKDPGMDKRFSDPSRGIGATYAWSGNKQVGKGQMAITDSQVNQSVTLQLDIEAPFEAHNLVEFTLSPEQSSTIASWTMIGSQNFFMRAMSMFFNMDKMVGADFEIGLRSLKALAED